MRYKLIIVISFLTFCYKANSTINIVSLIEHDTIIISYHIAYFGEYGGVDEGIILFKEKGTLKAMYVRYNSDNNSPFNWTEQKVTEYFTNLHKDYYVIRDTWILDTSQVAFVNQLLEDFENYIPEEGISNAAEFYQLSIKDVKHVVIDRLGIWDKYKEIHQSFNIKVEIPRRLYFLGIKIKDREVEYIVN